MITVVKMVEALFERSPNYKKQSKFLIFCEKPNVTALNNYAVRPHLEFEFFQLRTSHFHFLIEIAIDVKTKEAI